MVTRTSGTVEEPETTVPASPQALIAARLAVVDAPPTIVDALEEDLATNTGETEVGGSDDDVSEPMATRPATHIDLRVGLVEVSSAAEPTQWDSGAQFSLASRASGLISSETSGF